MTRAAAPGARPRDDAATNRGSAVPTRPGRASGGRDPARPAVSRRDPGRRGGFIGVDVFFILSGFLITGLLIHDREATGRIRLGAFYARRVRRILPAAVVVVAGTLLAAELLLSPLDVPRVADDGLAAVLSLSNVRFALDATDYFAPIDPSPLLHYWSLAVEEQFYLLWPLLLLVAARLGRPRVAMAGVAAIVLVGSFVLSVALTDVSGPWAYVLAADPSLAAGRWWPPRARGSVARLAAWPVRRRDRLAGRRAAGRRIRGDRSDDRLPGLRGTAADRRHDRDHRVRRRGMVTRFDRAHQDAASMARPDLVLPVSVALADPHPRPGGARPCEC